MVTRDKTKSDSKPFNQIVELSTAKAVRQLVPKGTSFAVAAVLTEQGTSSTALLCVGSDQLSIIGANGALAQVGLADVSAKLDHGEYTIYLPDHTYKLSALSPISDTGGQFASRVAGINGGAMPLLNALSSGGASVSGISGAKYYIAVVLFSATLVIVIGTMFYLGIK